MIYLLIVFPLVMAAVTFALPSTAGGRGSCPWGRLGHLALVLSAVFRPGDAPAPSRGWEAGCCSIRSASSPRRSSACSSSSARSTRRVIWPCAPTGPTGSSAPTCS